MSSYISKEGWYCNTKFTNMLQIIFTGVNFSTQIGYPFNLNTHIPTGAPLGVGISKHLFLSIPYGLTHLTTPEFLINFTLNTIGGGGGVLSTNDHTGTCRKHGSQFRPFGISMTPYFFSFGGIRVGGKSLLVYQWGLITFWHINGS